LGVSIRSTSGAGRCDIAIAAIAAAAVAQMAIILALRRSSREPGAWACPYLINQLTESSFPQIRRLVLQPTIFTPPLVILIQHCLKDGPVTHAIGSSIKANNLESGASRE